MLARFTEKRGRSVSFMRKGITIKSLIVLLISVAEMIKTDPLEEHGMGWSQVEVFSAQLLYLTNVMQKMPHHI